MREEGGNAHYTVRRAREADLARIIAINRATLPENYPEWFFHEHLEKWGKAFYVAEVEGSIVGYVMTRVEYGTSILHPYKLTRRGHIVSIAVLPPYRRKGIGTSLLRHALHSLRYDYGCEEAYLEVRVSNEPAINMYKKLGFQIVKTIPLYYMDGEDAYVMGIDLRELGKEHEERLETLHAQKH